MTRPIPIDMAELTVRLLRPRLLTAGPGMARTQVSTETGRGADGGPPTLPWLQVSEDGHTWSWPAIQRATIRLTCWDRNTHAAKLIVALAMGLLCDPVIVVNARPFLGAEPASGPLPATDPYTGASVAFGTVIILARTPAPS